MKLADALNEVKLNKDDLDDVRTEVESSFDSKEMKSFKNFKDFFAEVDVQNATEADWNPKKWKPFYKEIYQEFKSGKLKFAG